MELNTTQQAIKGKLIEDIKMLQDIVDNKMDQVTGHNHENSLFNKGVNITLKRDK